MKFTKEALIVGFALFALFFGAGNLILKINLKYANWCISSINLVILAVI